MTSATTLLGALDAARTRDRTVTYLSGDNERRTVSFRELHANALGVLAWFQQAGFQPGDHVILFTSSNEQFIDGFWACLAGGFVPVPVAVGISDDHRDKLLRIFTQLNGPRTYTDNGALQRLRDYGRDAGRSADVEALIARAVVVESITDVSRPGTVRAASPDDVAFIQFSSGSTSTPKGVVLTHRNVMANIAGIVSAARFTAADVAFSWMPLTHDMGLIGFHLCMLATGISHTIMDTRLFSRRPLLWLKEATAARATILSSPNFGYKHFLKVFESKGGDGIDLSHVRLLFNGAEPISVPLCQHFVDAMSRFGLARSAMFPVYGLAEASLAVTFPTPGTVFRSLKLDRHSLAVGRAPQHAAADSRDALELMVCGRPIPGCQVRIADDADKPLAEGLDGSVQIRGDNVTRGYLGADAAQPFTADGWLRTGDLGLFDAGELVITGRHKDIIFVNGQNYYPHDLEAIVEQEPGIELGKVAIAAARRASDDEDQLVVFVLHRGAPAEFAPLAARIRRHLTEQTSLQIAEVVPIRTMPKTTSGKVQRGKLAEQFAAGEFDAVLTEVRAIRAATVDPDAGSDTEQAVHAICAQIITDRAFGIADDLFELGVSSLALAQIFERIDEQWPGAIDVEDLFNLPTIRAIAARLDSSVTGSQTNRATA